MSLLSTIKDDQLDARKHRNKFLAQTLTTIIGEAEKIGKDAGNRETTDAETVKVLKKFRGGVQDTLKIMSESNELKNNNTTTQDEELRIVNDYIPTQLTENELTNLFLNYESSLPDQLTLPLGMKFIKTHYDGLYDGQLASIVLKDVISSFTQYYEDES